MKVTEAIRQRRSIKAFQERAIPADVLRQIVDAAYLAPTGGNNPSREFLVVTDREQLNNLSGAHSHCKFLAGAVAAIALLGKPAQSRYWVEDCGVAGAHVWLSAVSLGLGAAWAAMYQSDNEQESVRREQYCRDVLGIPGTLRVVGVLALGYPVAIPDPKPRPDFATVVHWGSYSQP